MPNHGVKTALALSAAVVAQTGYSASAWAQSCDRACILKLTDDYIAAMVAHDPSKAPLAPDLVFVENVKRMQAGDGLWKSITAGPTTFKITVPDVALQQAGWMGVIQSDGKPMMLAMRLKIANGKITQAEHILAAPLGGATNPNIATPRPGLVSDIPPGKRLSHDRLAAIGMTYYDALDDNDGSKMPFAADCQRRENGMTTAGEGAGAAPTKDDNKSPIAHDCKGQMDSGSFTYIDRIENRRLIAADPQTGLAMALSHFRHPFTNLPYKVKHIDGSTSERNAQNMPYKPFDMPAAHIFRIGPEGTVHEIEAVGFTTGYNSPTGWEGVKP